jgi:hypothetical protein
LHITHWVPSSGRQPEWSCVKSWANIEIPEGATKKFVVSPPGSVKVFWNKVLRDFLDSGSDWLFSTHHDVEFVPQTLKHLLSWDKPLISALIFMRHSPVVPQIWRHNEGEPDENYVMRVNDTRRWFYARKEYIRFGPFVMDPRPEDALVDAGFTSTSCTLVHRSVLETIAAEVGDNWFECDNELTGGGEDRRFFEYARDCGYPCWIDRSCIAGHVVGDISTSSADFIAWDSVSTFLGTGENA